MWRARFFSRLERTHIPGHEKSKSQGVAMTSESGREGSSGIRGEIETRDPRAVILAFFFPEATSSPARKELREIADRNRRCSNALRVPPPA